MDAITQGVIGAAAAQAVYGERLGRWSLAIGWAAGMLPDADVFVRSASDPLLAWTAHRTFTHGLAFIPVGALVAALPFLLSRTLRPRWKEVYGAALLGYATHGILDAFTTYGTVLLWPFSDLRVAWDVISIVDPVFTMLLLAGVVWSAIRRRVGPARLGLACAAAYMALCALQHHRAAEAQERMIAARGHQASAARVMPTLGNNVLFRSLYRTSGGEMYADAIRVPLLGPPTMRPGARVDVLDPEGLAEGAADPQRVRRDLARFAWFTGGYWARTPGWPELIGDMRITTDPAGVEPLWGVVIEPAAPIPVQAADGHGRDAITAGALWREIMGGDPRHVPVPGADSRAGQ